MRSRAKAGGQAVTPPQGPDNGAGSPGPEKADEAAAADKKTLAARRAEEFARRRGTGHQFGFRTLFADSVIYGGGRMLQKFLSALLLPLYTVFLTPVDYGILGMVLVTTTLIDIFVTLGWDNTFARFYYDDRSEEHRSKVITQTFYVSTIYPAILLGTIAVFMPQISQALMGAPGYAIYFDLGLLALFFTNMNDIPFTLFRLNHQPWRFVTFDVARIFIQVPTTIVLVTAFHMGVTGVLIGNLATPLILNIAALPTYWRRLHFTWEPQLFREMLSFAIPSLFAGMAFYILNLSDRYLLRALTPGGHNVQVAEVGLYTTAYTLAQPIYFAMNAFRMAWPQWHYSWLHDPPRHKRLVAQGYTYFIAFSLVLLTGMGVFMPLFVRLLLHKPSFWSVGSTTMVLATSTVFFGSYYLFAVGANVMKKNRLFPVITAVAAAVNVVLNLLFIPDYGMMAAAWSTLIGFALLALLMRQISQHYYPIPHEWMRMLKLALATTLTIVAADLLGALLHAGVYQPFSDVLWKNLVKTPLLALFPLTLWATAFYRAEEKRLIRRVWHGLLHPVAAVRRRRAAATARKAATATPTAEPAAAAVAAATAEAAATIEGEVGLAAATADGEEPPEFTEEQYLDAEEQEAETVAELGIKDEGLGP